jgi:transposase
MSFIRRIKKGGSIYLAETESKWIKGKSVQRHIRYIGKEADGRTVLSTSMSDAEVEEVKLYGPLLVLHHIASEIGLSDKLGKYSNEILSMVYAHCLDYQSLNQITNWFQRTDLGLLLNIEELTEKRLLNALDSLEAVDQDSLQRNIFETVKEKYDLNNEGVIYDVTNTYLYGKKCPLGKYGHDKEGVKGRPLIQIGLGVTKGEGIPILHKTFHGNIHDSRTLQDMITSLRHYGFKSGLIFFDRGIFSEKNIADIAALKWDTICGMALNEGLKKFWKPFIEKNKTSIDLSHRVELNETVFYAVSKPYNVKHIKGHLHLCFNKQQQLNMWESRRSEVLYAQEQLHRNRGIKPDLEQFIDKKGRLNKSALQAAEEFDGYSCIFSTRSIPPSTLIPLYFDKDIVEKAFHNLKGVVHLRPVRHWLYKRVIAHVFICYLSYLLLSLLKYRLKSLAISPAKALQELETMYKVYLRDPKHGFKVSRVVNLSKTQERILKTIDKSLLSAIHQT